MATTYTLHPAATDHSETRVVHRIYTTTKILFGTVGIVVGLDKFTNLIVNWEQYLNPIFLRIVPVTAHQFMLAVGVIEIIAGIIVFLRPRLGGYIMMAWLLAISAQLLMMGQYLDIAVRDVVMALGGALTLARLTPHVQGTAALR